MRYYKHTYRNLSLVCAAMSRTEYWRDPPFTSLACAGSHVGLCAVDMLEQTRRKTSKWDDAERTRGRSAD